jgi:adenosine deaminase
MPNTRRKEFFAHFAEYRNFDEFSKAWKYKNSLIRSYDDFSFLMDGYIKYLKEQHIIYVEPAIAMFELPPLKADRLIEIAYKKLKENGIQFSFIMDLIRGDGPEELQRQYNFYHELASEYNIRGVGLAGNEKKHGLNPNLIPIFDRAKDDGYGITIHLGEESLDADYKLAVEGFHANRLGHFISAFSGHQ